MAYETITVPKNSVVVPRNYSLDQSIEFVASVRMDRLGYAQQMWEISGCDYTSPCLQTLNEIDHAIGRLKQMRAELQRFANHQHEWTDNDYCAICGADGRA